MENPRQHDPWRMGIPGKAAATARIGRQGRHGDPEEFVGLAAIAEDLGQVELMQPLLLVVELRRHPCEQFHILIGILVESRQLAAVHQQKEAGALGNRQEAKPSDRSQPGVNCDAISSATASASPGPAQVAGRHRASRFQARINPPTAKLSPIPSPKVRANPSVGSRTKPVSAAPSTVPSVLTANTLPTERPVRANSTVATRLTNGRVVPRQIAGRNITAKQIRPWASS